MITQNLQKERVLSDRERKNINILDLIRKNGPIAKTEISRLTGLNIVTVSNYIENFIEKKFVYEKGLDISTGGRRPILVDLNSDLYYVVGVGVSMFNITAVMTDLRGKVINSITIDKPLSKGEDLINQTISITEDLLNQSDIAKDNIVGIGVGMRGIIDEKAQTIRWWNKENNEEVMINVSIAEKFKEKFGIDTLVESDANAAVFGEKWYALHTDVKHMLYMYSSTSCGIIINGEIYRGISGNAGGLGITGPSQQNDTLIDTGLQLWPYEIDSFIIDEAQSAWDNDRFKDSKIFKAAENDPKKVTPNMILQVLKERDPLAIEIIEKAGSIFGKKLAFLINLLNPEVVVIGGGIEQAGSIFLDAVKKTVNYWSIDEATSGLKIIPTQLGENAVAIGAAAVIVEQIFAQI